MTYRGALLSLGDSPGGTALAKLRQRGFFVLADVRATGYHGETFRVNCTATDNRTNASSTDGHEVSIAKPAETTQPCWLSRPGPAKDRYTVAVDLLDSHGEVQTQDVVTGG